MACIARKVLALLTVLSVAACGEGAVVPDDDPVLEVAQVVASADSILVPAVGFSRNVTATVLDRSGTTLTGASVGWGSRSPVVAGVDAVGRVEGRGLGVASVIVSAGSVADTVIVTVDQVPETILITQEVDTLEAIGAESQLLVAAWDSAGAVIPPLSGRWTSSDTTLAEIDEFGRITFRRAGTATFQWARRGISASTTMTVRQVANALRVGGGQSTLAPGDTTTIQATLLDWIGGEIIDASIVWSSNDESVATVSQEGLVTAVGGGQVLIEAESEGLVGPRALTVSHSVPPAGALVVSPAILTADAQGEFFFLAAHVDAGSGAPVAVPATWHSRDTRVARLMEGALLRTEGDGQTWLVAHYDGRIDSLSITVDRTPVGISFQGAPREVTVEFSTVLPVRALAVDRLGAVVSGPAVWTVRDPEIATWSGTGIEAQRAGTTWAIVEVVGQVDSVRVTVVPEYHDDYGIESTEDLDWLDEREIEHVSGFLRVIESAVANLDGLESLRSTGGLWITRNDNLTDLSGLANLETVTGDIVIEENAALANATLPSLTTAASVSVLNNLGVDQPAVFPALRTLSGLLRYGESGPATSFPLLEFVGAVDVVSPGPGEISFPALKVVAGDLQLIDVSETLIFAAPRLWRVRGLTVRGNSQLTTLRLPGLTTIERDLEVAVNPLLTDLSHLSVTSGVANLLVRNNDVLSSLSGLMGLGDALGSDPVVTEDLRFANNPSLPSAAIEAIFAFIEEKFVGLAFLRGVLSAGNG